MPTFVYEATDPQGKLVTGSQAAQSRQAVIEKLQKENLFPILVEAEAKRKELPVSLTFKRRPISQKELLDFTRQMATLMRSGLELDRCLTVLHELAEKEKTRTVIKSIQEAVHGGDTLSGALTKQEGAFSSLYLNMVKAGEAGGFLEEVFSRLAEFLEGRLRLIESVRSALVYPAVVAVAALLAMTILTGYVIPKFAAIFEDMGAELPASTQFLLDVSEIMTTHYPWIILGIVALVTLIRIYLATEFGKRQVDVVLLKLPVINSLVQRIIVSQFTRTLGTLLQSGVPIIQSLGIVRETIANKVIGEMLEKTTTGVKEGKRLSTLIKGSGLFPPLAVHMIMVGEESGKMDEMMIQMATIYDGEVELAVKRMITLLEPLMILVMGVGVAFVVISMLSAIFSINDLPF